MLIARSNLTLARIGMMLTGVVLAAAAVTWWNGSDAKEGPAACGIGRIKGHPVASDLTGHWVGDNFGQLTLTDPGVSLDEDQDLDDRHMGKLVYTDWPTERIRWKNSRRISGTGHWWLTRQANGYDVLTIQYKDDTYHPRTTTSEPLFAQGPTTRPRLVTGTDAPAPDPARCDLTTFKRERQ